MNARLWTLVLLLRCSLTRGGRGDSTGTSFLIVLADDLGYGDLASYGHPSSSTPRLDELGAQGIRFTSFYSASPVCSPSRAAVVTGRLPARNGVYCANGTEPCAGPEDDGCCPGVFVPGRPGGLPLTERTFATELKARGWHGATGMIGKWHLGMQEFMPTAGHGFDFYFGVPHGLGSCPCTACFAPNETCAISCQPTWAPCPLFENQTIVQQPADLLTLSSAYVRAGRDFIRRSVNRGVPFLLYFCSHHVHSPQFAGYDETNATIRGRFGDSLAELDRSVGSLLDSLEDLGVADNTLVWFTSDNGPSLRNEKRGGNAGLLKCGKGTTYEGGVRVPAMVRWGGGGVRGGTVCRKVVSTLDIFPTILSIATGNKVQKNSITLDGFDMTNMLTSSCSVPSPRKEKNIYYPQFARRDRGLFALRIGTDKVHFHTRGSLQSGAENRDSDCRPSANYTSPLPPLVYDLGTDPSENYALEGRERDSVVGRARSAAEEHERGMIWYPTPQLGGAFNPHLWPCAKLGCTPFPSCCVTD